MFYKYEAEKGSIMLNKSVLFKIVTEVIERYEGKVVLASTITKTGFFQNLLGQKNEESSLDIYFDKEGKLLVEIKTMLRFGTSIRNTCEQLSREIKDEIETQTSIEVKKVDISVEGMFSKRRKKKNDKDFPKGTA